MYEQTHLFLITKGNQKLCKGPPPRLIEFNKLKFFWKNFGLSKKDLEECDSEWISEIMEVNAAISEVERQELEKVRNSSNSQANKLQRRGRQVQTEKIL